MKTKLYTQSHIKNSFFSFALNDRNFTADFNTFCVRLADVRSEMKQIKFDLFTIKDGDYTLIAEVFIPFSKLDECDLKVFLNKGASRFRISSENMDSLKHKLKKFNNPLMYQSTKFSSEIGVTGFSPVKHYDLNDLTDIVICFILEMLGLKTKE